MFDVAQSPYDLFDTIIDGVYGIDTRGHLIYMNRVLRERRGIQPGQYRRIHYLDLIDLDYHEQAKRNFERIMGGKEVIPLELEYTDAGGQIRIVEVHSRPVYENGQVVGLIGISRDITSRKIAEKKLHECHARYRAVLENAGDAILLADLKGNILEANRKAENLFGYSREEFPKLHYSQIHPMTELDRTIRAFKTIVRQGAGTLNDGAILQKGGGTIPVDIACSVIEIGNSKVVQASFRDISERKQAMESLEQLVRERTAELTAKNELLLKAIGLHKTTEAELKKNDRKQKRTLKALHDLNVALKVLLKQREDDKKELEDNVMTNVKQHILPHLEALKRSNPGKRMRGLVNVLESGLMRITAPFSNRMSSKYGNLTTRELQIAGLIRDGRTSKEIADMMCVSASNVHVHRYHIRSKLGIKNTKTSLRSHLTAFAE